MAATDRSQQQPGSSGIVASMREAAFLHLVARADGAALAAAGILAAACVSHDIPYQVRFVRTRAALEATTGEAGDERAGTVVLGAAHDGPAAAGPTLAVDAYRAADELGADPDPACALAGVAAAGEPLGSVAADVLETAGIDRHDGIALPTTAPADVAYSTLGHADFSGDPEATRAAFGGLDDVGSREAASLFAVAVVGARGATDRAATAIERGLRPYAGGPFGTIGGYADVLSALAHTTPSRGVALGLGAGDVDGALSTWREHGRAVHRGVRTASTVRHHGLLVARTTGPVEPIARILRDFRSPEPVVVAVDAAAAGIAARDRVPAAFTAAAERVDGSGLVDGRRGYAAFDPDRTDEFIDAVVEGR